MVFECLIEIDNKEDIHKAKLMHLTYKYIYIKKKQPLNEQEEKKEGLNPKQKTTPTSINAHWGAL